MPLNQNNNGDSETVKHESLGNGKASVQATIADTIRSSSTQEENKWLGTGVASSSGIHSS